MSHKYTNMEYLQNYDIYFPQRLLYVVGSVTQDMYLKIAKNLLILEQSTGTITIKVYSDGGDTVACRAIYDTIQHCRNFVRIIVYGEACSSASIILQAADERVMAPSSELMIHLGQESYGMEHPRNIDALRTSYRRIENWMRDVYMEKIKVKKPRFTNEKYADLVRFDKYLTPQQALELGLTDRIGGIL